MSIWPRTSQLSAWGLLRGEWSFQKNGIMMFCVSKPCVNPPPKGTSGQKEQLWNQENLVWEHILFFPADCNLSGFVVFLYLFAAYLLYCLSLSTLSSSKGHWGGTEVVAEIEAAVFSLICTLLKLHPTFITLLRTQSRHKPSAEEQRKRCFHPKVPKPSPCTLSSCKGLSSDTAHLAPIAGTAHRHVSPCSSW